MFKFLKLLGAGLTGTTALLFVVFMICLAFCLTPLLVLWALNTLSEQANLGWYIPHSFWTYVATFVLAVIFGGSSSPSKN
jgi:hypothetical protein